MADVSKLEDNVWYAMTETRVNWTSSFQFKNNALVFNDQADTTVEYWQLLRLGNGNFVIRNNASVSPTIQLTTCYRASENSTGKTQACMLTGIANDPSQQWTIDTSWDDGTYRIQNVGNGTGYNLDVHKGTPLFLSDDISASSANPAQHWLISSKKDINDATYSTQFGLSVRETQFAETKNFTDNL
jgi:hypothetical protein